VTVGQIRVLRFLQLKIPAGKTQSTDLSLELFGGDLELTESTSVLDALASMEHLSEAADTMTRLLDQLLKAR
jgi:hypothetical protein